MSKFRPLQKLPTAVFALFPGPPGATSTLTFRVPRTITKPEIEEYLRKIYRLDVAKVNTANFLGGEIRVPRGFKKIPDYKKAIVTLATPVDMPELPMPKAPDADEKASE